LSLLMMHNLARKGDLYMMPRVRSR
jgi:hypothetical protein